MAAVIAAARIIVITDAAKARRQTRIGAKVGPRYRGAEVLAGRPPCDPVGGAAGVIVRDDRAFADDQKVLAVSLIGDGI